MFLDMQKYRTTSKRSDAKCIRKLSIQNAQNYKIDLVDDKEMSDGRVLVFFYYIYLLTELSRRKQYQKTNDLALVYGLVCLGVIKIGGMIINFFFEKYLRNLDSTAECRSEKSIIIVFVDVVSLIFRNRGKNRQINQFRGALGSFERGDYHVKKHSINGTIFV